MNLNKTKILWVDVGTHFGQEFSSIFGSYLWFLYKIFRRMVGALIFKKGEHLKLIDTIRIFKKKIILKNKREKFYVLCVEANPKILRNKVYEKVDSINCFALGGNEDSKLGNLFFADGDDTGQGSSIFKEKGNIDLDHSVLVNIVSPIQFAKKIKRNMFNNNIDYKVILRINCEGSEDEIIYAFKEVFGDNFSEVFGSLKDVKGVKGEKAYNDLVNFMTSSKIHFTDFSSSVLSWPNAFSRINNISNSI